MEGRPTRKVRGTVVLPDDVPSTGSAELVVRVEDVSRADAPSVVIGETRLEDVPLEPGGTLPFEVDVAADVVEHGHSYAISAHLDLSRSGTVEIGDYVSTQSNPVLTYGYGDEAVVAVRRV